MTRKMSALILAAAVTGAWALSQPAQAQVTEARGESTTEDGARGDEASVPREERIAREWRSLPKGERIAREQRGQRAPRDDLAGMAAGTAMQGACRPRTALVAER